MQTPNDPRYIDWLVKLAEENRGKGIIEEPRLFWDIAQLRNEEPLITDFTGGVFQNGEQFPVRLTHLILAPYVGWGDEVEYNDERLAQRVGVRLRLHDTFYMNNLLLPAPIWANKVLAAPEPVSYGGAHWTLDRPVILSARDTFKIDVAPLNADALSVNDGTFMASVTATGVGLLSKRPYMLGSTKEFVGGDPRTTFHPNDFKNDGTEPIAITDFGFNALGGSSVSSRVGDIRRWKFQVQQLGNGTGRPWFVGPDGQPLAPGQLLGLSQGRSIVHRFPGDGIVWEPGESLSAQAQALADGTQGMKYLIAFAGYIAIE